MVDHSRFKAQFRKNDLIERIESREGFEKLLAAGLPYQAEYGKIDKEHSNGWRLAGTSKVISEKIEQVVQRSNPLIIDAQKEMLDDFRNT